MGSFEELIHAADLQDIAAVLRLGKETRAESTATVFDDGGAEGDRTPDLCIANAPLSQLSYGPKRTGNLANHWR